MQRADENGEDCMTQRSENRLGEVVSGEKFVRYGRYGGLLGFVAAGCVENGGGDGGDGAGSPA